MTRLILIRHGETDYIPQNRYCGFSDPSLNNKGRWQAGRLSVRLAGLKIDKIYSSDLKRAHETAQIIFNGSAVEKTADFREINFGIFEGLKHEEILKKYHRIYKDWVNNPEKIEIPGGEGLRDLRKRVRNGICFIFSRFKDGVIAVVAHGGPIKIILCQAMGYGLEDFRKITQNAGALNIVDYRDGLPPVVIKMNDTAHLSEEGAVFL